MVPKTLPQGVARANIERSIILLSEGMELLICDIAKIEYV